MPQASISRRKDHGPRGDIPDPAVAAEMFAGMALGHGHLRSLLGVAHPSADRIPQQARETARRFIRALGIVHKAKSRSISDHSAWRTSLDRAAV